MKIITAEEVKTLSGSEILAIATGKPEEQCRMNQVLHKRLAIAERDRDYWRDLAITTQQKLEAMAANDPK